MSSASWALIILREVLLGMGSGLWEPFSLEILGAYGENLGSGCEHSMTFLRAKGAFLSGLRVSRPGEANLGGSDC